jgi:hypothetical protein
MEASTYNGNNLIEQLLINSWRTYWNIRLLNAVAALDNLNVKIKSTCYYY